MSWEIFWADCVDYLGQITEPIADAIVTDPPYGLHFMGQAWDQLGKGASEQIAWHLRWTEQAYLALPPGGHVLAFGGTRTSPYLALALEAAGFEPRDTLMWLYGSGFPKGGTKTSGRAGWGSQLKPAHEPILLFRRPLDGTLGANVQQHGTGALNIDGTRIGGGGQRGWDAPRGLGYHGGTDGDATLGPQEQGRWPANVLLDPAAAELLDGMVGELSPEGGPKSTVHDTGMFGIGVPGPSYHDRGGPSRFFYTPKASTKEREAGLDAPEAGRANQHPTVKPIALMRWLVRLITPPDGLVLDPFCGSGTTGIAAGLEGFDFLGIEIDYIAAELSRARIAHWLAESGV